MNDISDVTYKRMVAEATKGCCGDAAWRGYFCQYHQGYADGLEAGFAAGSREEVAPNNAM